ncbi:VPLPA-CTERM sorting domain-containing protein [Poseidonocella sedimentorum]|nr:VPLPA-CTERM sorting domain-containing protein [Poseidonocella sedimentorum]
MAFIISLATCPAQAASVTLSSLLGGGSVTEGDVTFGTFAFLDLSDVASYPEDREVAPSEVLISTSATASSVTLTATFDPSITLVADGAFFKFFLDFVASVDAPSTRQISGVSLTGDIIHAGSDSGVEAVYALGGFGSIGGPEIEIFSAPGFGTQISDGAALGTPVSALLMEGKSEGGIGFDSSAHLSTYSLTFDLLGDPPVTTVVPLPAGLPLLLAGLGGLALVRRRHARP